MPKCLHSQLYKYKKRTNTIERRYTDIYNSVQMMIANITHFILLIVVYTYIILNLNCTITNVCTLSFYIFITVSCVDKCAIHIWNLYSNNKTQLQ